MPGIVAIMGPLNTDVYRSRLDLMLGTMMKESFYSQGTSSFQDLGVAAGIVAIKDSVQTSIPAWDSSHRNCLLFYGEEFSDACQYVGLRSEYLVRKFDDRDDFYLGLNGRFSGIIIQPSGRKVHIFNDRFGLGRIYYYESHGTYYFSSEAKAILGVCPELRQIDPTSLGEMFSLGCVLQNRSPFLGLSILPPASHWTYSPETGLKKECYFRPSDWEGRGRLSIERYLDEFQETWRKILPRYFRGPERIGLSLTGGKDSRMILAYASARPSSLPCYTFGGTYRESMDVKVARKIAGICKQPFRTICVDEDFLANFPSLAERTVRITDGAMDVSGAGELYVNTKAREIAPIRLTGNYAQEILLSSVAFKPVPFQAGFLDPDFGRMVQQATLTYQEEARGDRLSFIAFKQMPWHHYNRLSLELSQLLVRSPYLDNEIVELAYRYPVDPMLPSDFQLKVIAEESPSLARIGTDRDLLYRPSPLTSKAKHFYQDFMAKAEYAYDYGMPQWLSRIDRIMKPLHAERLFLGRQKFVHYRIWYRDKLSKYVREILLDDLSKQRAYLKGSSLEKMIGSHINGTANYTLEIHRLLTTELLQREFID